MSLYGLCQPHDTGLMMSKSGMVPLQGSLTLSAPNLMLADQCQTSKSTLGSSILQDLTSCLTSYNAFTMAEHQASIDISAIPELLELAEEVRRTHTPRVLRRDREELAVVVPLPAHSKRGARAKTDADYEAFRRAAGGWKDVDTDKLIEDIYESRRRSSRPPVDL